GSRFDSLNNKEIWLSELGVIRCPDIRAFPYENSELILTGYSSPTLNKGLRFNQQTYAPYHPGDSLIIQSRDLNPYVPSPDRSNILFIHHLITHLSTVDFNQKWVAKTTRYDLKKGAFVLVQTSLNDTINLKI